MFGIKDRICHIGSIVVPDIGKIYWMDTIKGVVYKVIISFEEEVQ